MKKTCILLAALCLLLIQNKAQTVKDADSNVYYTVAIGKQLWLKENLRATHYRDGNEIHKITDNKAWGATITGAYCNYNNDTSITKEYGYLYNYYAVKDGRGICPEGWHVPSEADWDALIEYIGDKSIVGGALKESDTIHWLDPNAGADNSTGFTAVPGGYRSDAGIFGGINKSNYMWSSTDFSGVSTWGRVLSYANNAINRSNFSKSYGFTVRCVKYQ